MIIGTVVEVEAHDILSKITAAVVVPMFIIARVSVDVRVISVVVLGVFGLSGPVLATIVVHVRLERYLMTPTSSGRR